MNNEPNNSIILADKPKVVSISSVDSRQHTYIIGKTGTGKTTLSKNAVIQHIFQNNGVAFIDPHGSDAQEIVSTIPRCRERDLIYFNPGDTDYPISWNLLNVSSEEDYHLVASNLVDAFKSIWKDNWGPRLEYILYNSLVALLYAENTSLLGMLKMLTDKKYRQLIVRQVSDPTVRTFWQNEFEAYDKRFRFEAIAPIQNKIGKLLSSPIIRNVLGQTKNKLDFQSIINDNHIFIANLSKGKIGEEESNLLGALLVAQFKSAAMAREKIPESHRKNFYLFVDEFQNFANTSFASILSEARKYRLCLTLSHQYIGQLPEEVRKAIFGNCGTLIAFRVGSSDAQILEKEFDYTWPAHNFSDLPRYEILIRPLVSGEIIDPFKTKTISPTLPYHERKNHLKGLINQSRRRYTKPRVEVEKQINRWYRNP